MKYLPYSVLILTFQICFSIEIVNYTFPDSSGYNCILSLAIDSDGNKWFGTFYGVSKFDGMAWVTFDNTDGVDDCNTAVAVDAHNKIWVGGIGAGGAFVFDGNRWDGYTVATSMAITKMIRDIAIDSSGIVWFGTSCGVSTFDGNIVTQNVYNKVVLSMIIEKNGNKWCGTYEGVNAFDGIDWKIYTTQDGLSSDTIWAIEKDKEGNIWAGTSRGVNKFNGYTWTTYDTSDGLAGNRVSAIVIGTDGSKWFATRHGVSCFDDSTWTTYDSSDGLVSDSVLDMAIDPVGNIWCASAKTFSKLVVSSIGISHENTTYTTTQMQMNAAANQRKKSMHISFDLHKKQHVALGVYDAKGSCIASLIKGYKNRGRHCIILQIKYLASGIYFLRLQTEMSGSVTRKIIIAE